MLGQGLGLLSICILCPLSPTDFFPNYQRRRRGGGGERQNRRATQATLPGHLPAQTSLSLSGSPWGPREWSLTSPRACQRAEVCPSAPPSSMPHLCVLALLTTRDALCWGPGVSTPHACAEALTPRDGAGRCWGHQGIADLTGEAWRPLAFRHVSTHRQQVQPVARRRASQTLHLLALVLGAQPQS